MRSALEIGSRRTGLREHVADGIDVTRLPRMACTQQRDLLRGEPKMLHAARGDEWKRLHGFERAPRERQRLRIPGGVEKSTAAIDDGDRTVVDAFDGRAAGYDGKRNMRRDRGVGEGQRQNAR